MSRFTVIAGILCCCFMLSGCQNRSGNPEIVTAVALNDVAKVEAYLAGGGDPDLKSADGKPLLYLAAGPRGGLEVLQSLIAGGAALNVASAEGRTVLQNAAGWCAVEIVDALLYAGAEREKAGANGLIPLDVVCKSPQDRRELVIWLLTR